MGDDHSEQSKTIAYLRHWPTNAQKDSVARDWYALTILQKSVDRRGKTTYAPLSDVIQHDRAAVVFSLSQHDIRLLSSSNLPRPLLDKINSPGYPVTSASRMYAGNPSYQKVSPMERLDLLADSRILKKQH